ncbi:bifunctional 2-C-methyl-D-erythritol 4-phosphate cytidylyltransferase/2-C-methyl-D-erythritol 2,4-cyclodiphosphate synthase [Microcella alkalica]|uniref:Bifunctional enzyme IspD/IspF n=1 Tax=Microcella alkalica TaxID=355930 RepID=A0A839EFY5_9MICO|nr:2-C-methyl-D-erythritol 4-phosphate cytidylyltransferase/2-C-methyl-D-erythritol 2,4-cyclodiphosphate synthase [Microcella alkalica]
MAIVDASTAPAVGIVIVAAGSGTRLGHPEPKAFVVVGGRSLLERALEASFSLSEPASIVVVAPASHRAGAEEIAMRVAGAARDSVRVVVGGATRQQSVGAGLAALPEGTREVLIHDAARALQPVAVFERVVARIRADGVGVVPALPVVDTIARRAADDRVVEPVDRADLAVVQTPQGFPFPLYRAALASAAADHTDDMGVHRAAGQPVVVVEGDARGFKITTPWDLRRAEQLLGAERPALRSGIGIDVHAYDERAPLWLGGLHWPEEPGLAGHSDGDAISHAMCDALLSAAGLGDIGSRFGVDDPRFADARGEVFVTATLGLVRAAGFEVVNVAVQIVARRPRFAPRRLEVEALLSRLVGAPVSVSATTSDGLGFTGRGEGVTAVATCLLVATPAAADPRR